MGISAIIGSSLYRLLSHTSAPSAYTGNAGAGTAVTDTDGLRSLFAVSTRLLRKISEVRQALDTSFITRKPVIGGATTSGVVLLPETCTTLTGTAEVNATSTSFSPFGPGWKRGSTAPATVTGVYNGSDGTATMKVHVLTGGTVGGNTSMTLRATVNTRSEDIVIPAGTPAGTRFTLSNGIVLSLESGTLVKNDNIDINLYSTVGSVVNPNLPFNGTRSTYPNFEYGRSVTTGTFEVNGTTINVSAGDTLNQVLSRISLSTAGVAAVFDSASETVKLTSKVPGVQAITLSNDSSGFLAATKLAGATPVIGRSEETDRIAQVARLSGIATGTLYVNHVAVAVNTANDSVQDIVNRINAAGAGVTATVTDGRVQLASDAVFEVDNGTSGFFAGLGIQAGTYGSPASRRAKGTVDIAVGKIREMADLMNELFRNSSITAVRSGKLRDSFTDLASNAFRRKGTRFDSGFGIAFDFNSSAKTTVIFSANEAEELRQTLVSDPTRVTDLFLRSLNGKGEGFLDLLSEELRSTRNEISERFSGIGLNLDTLA